MIAACGDLGVQPVETLFEKVVQVYEMMIVRHGFMLVGMPWAGKTIAAKVRGCSLLRAVKCCMCCCLSSAVGLAGIVSPRNFLMSFSLLRCFFGTGAAKRPGPAC
jgi:hypothetical protein